MANFDELALAYDDAIDWSARLKRELPFILDAFTDSRRILDMACGSGRHAVAIAKKGYIVDAFDTSEVMITTAKTLAKQRAAEVEFSVSDMLEISERYTGKYDGILCLGNSLALLPHVDDLRLVLSKVAGLLSDKGSFVFQTLNFEEIEATGFTKFDSKDGSLRTGQKVVFNRQFEHPSDDSETTTLILSTMIMEDGKWVHNETRQSVLRLTISLLTELLGQTGLDRFDVYATYDKAPFEHETSRSIVIHAKRAI
ncbi:MAG: class I SAM-dependent methyltransferase [Candidatus Thorarchaeota archaeon]|nr:class I SAM-dependent methyltransferase [Candidatus Thorarchaeota archaeon]